MANGTLLGIMRDLIDGEVPRDPERWAGYVESQLRSVGYAIGADPTWRPLPPSESRGPGDGEERGERFDAPGCQMCGAAPGDPCDCHDPQV